MTEPGTERPPNSYFPLEKDRDENPCKFGECLWKRCLWLTFGYTLPCSQQYLAADSYCRSWVSDMPLSPLAGSDISCCTWTSAWFAFQLHYWPLYNSASFWWLLFCWGILQVWGQHHWACWRSEGTSLGYPVSRQPLPSLLGNKGEFCFKLLLFSFLFLSFMYPFTG